MMSSINESWIGAVGAGLAGIGAAINGVNSIMEIGHTIGTVDFSKPLALAGGSIGSLKLGAASLFLGTLKLGAAGAASALGFGAGCVGFTTFLMVNMLARRPLAIYDSPVAENEGTDAQPEWLRARVLNWGVIGRVGVGKSTLINALRGLSPQSPDAAPVGIGHTTRVLIRTVSTEMRLPSCLCGFGTFLAQAPRTGR